jgi:arylsulfatase A-like enzyme
VVGVEDSGTTPKKPPNIFFIAVDDLNDWTSLGKGHPQASTPNIQKLAERGLSFSNAHAAAPACAPSRAAVMTGIRPSTSGNYVNADSFTGNPILNEALTMPEAFQRAGYNVAGTGKLYHRRHFRKELYGRGFDVYWPSKTRDSPKGSMETATKRPMADFGQGVMYWDWGPLAPHVKFEETKDGQIVNWVVEQFREGKLEEPFFLGVGLIRPHLPFFAPQSYFDQFPIDEIVMPEFKEDDLEDVPDAGKAMGIDVGMHDLITGSGNWKSAVQSYLATTAFADDCVGRLLQSLHDSRFEENTIVVLWSDHGWQFGEKNHWSKFTLWERATRVTLVLAGPGIVEGRETDAPVNLLDLYSTIAQLAGLEVPVGQLEGRDLGPLLRDPDATWDHTSLTTYGSKNHSIRSRRWRYIRYEDGSEELYDHDADPNEWTNLATDPRYAEVIANLMQSLPSVNAPNNATAEFDPLTAGED